jgi:hypothetical protein
MTLRERVIRHAQLIAEHELRRVRSLPPHEAATVAEAARAFAAATAECLLQQAASEPALRAALAAIYQRDAPVTDRR